MPSLISYETILDGLRIVLKDYYTDDEIRDLIIQEPLPEVVVKVEEVETW